MNSQNKISQSQKLMVFVLSMSLYGLATLFTELIPSFQVGHRRVLGRVFPVYPADAGNAF